jgi:Peptidase M10 serralysin C terminal
VNVLPPSGQLTIDALLNPYGQYWDTSVSHGAITYSFYSANSGPYYGTEQVSEVNAAIKASVREILKNLETYINQRFVEVADTATSNGVMRYMFSNGGGGSNADFYAYSYYPHTEAIGSDVHLNPTWDAKSYASFSNGAGSNGYTTLIHETLHALGLKHPGDYDAMSHSTDGPFLDPSQDHKSNTVMSYNHVGTAAITPLNYDIRALQYLYGAKANAASNSTYQFTAPMHYQLDGQAFGNPAQAVNQSIWDGGGMDTIDLSGSTGFNYHIDLRDGGLITTQTALIGGNYTDRSTGQGFIAPLYGTWLGFGTVIENVVSSNGNDRIIANDAQNIFSGFDTGHFGDDVLENTNGFDRLDLSGNQRGQLRLTNNAGDLVIDWSSGDSIKVKNYFAPGNAAAMQILIEGQAFIVTATGTWQVV